MKGRRSIWASERRRGLARRLWYSWPLPALSHREVKVRGTRGSEEVRGTELARRSPPFLSWERTAVSDSVRVDVDPEPSRPRYRHVP